MKTATLADYAGTRKSVEFLAESARELVCLLHIRAFYKQEQNDDANDGGFNFTSQASSLL